LEAEGLSSQSLDKSELVSAAKLRVREDSWNRAVEKLGEMDRDIGLGFKGQTTMGGQKVEYVCRMANLTGCKARARIVQMSHDLGARIEIWREDHDHKNRKNMSMLRIKVYEAVQRIIEANEDIAPQQLHAKLRLVPYCFNLTAKEEKQSKVFFFLRNVFLLKNISFVF